MSLTATLHSALSGLNAAQRALGTTANNVANANTEGFSRKQANQATRIIDGVGQGVTTEETSRVVDEFLTVEIRKQLAMLGHTEAINNVLGQTEARVFGTPGDADRGLPNKFADLISAIEAVATTPENVAARGSAITQLEDLLQEIGGNAKAVQNIRADVDRQIKITVDAINADIESLENLNIQFARALPTAELLDQRDLLLKDLAEKIDISIFQQDNNAIAVYTATGAPLLEYQAKHLVYTPAASVAEGTTFRAIEIFDKDKVSSDTGLPLPGETGIELVSSGRRMDLTPEMMNDAIPDEDQIIVSPLESGQLQGLLEARDRFLPQLGDQIGELATMVHYNVNKAHNNAVPFPLPNSLSGSRAGLDDFDTAALGGNATGEAYLAVVDSEGTIAADISIDLTAYATADALAADLNAQLAGIGTATITADDRLEIALGNDAFGEPYGAAISEGDSAITYTDQNGRDQTYGLFHYFGANDLVVQDGTKTTELSIREDISADNSKVSRVILDHSTGAAIVGGAGDNRGLQNLADVLQEDFPTIDRGSLAGRPVSIGDYISDIVSTHAAIVAEAGNRADAHQSLTNELLQRHGSVSGVNLDEELSKLIVYQRAYTVSARVITVTNELFDELMNVGR